MGMDLKTSFAATAVMAGFLYGMKPSPAQRTVPKLPPKAAPPVKGKNQPCACGSGKKFKLCCLNQKEMAR